MARAGWFSNRSRIHLPDIDTFQRSLANAPGPVWVEDVRINISQSATAPYGASSLARVEFDLSEPTPGLFTNLALPSGAGGSSTLSGPAGFTFTDYALGNFNDANAYKLLPAGHYTFQISLSAPVSGSAVNGSVPG